MQPRSRRPVPYRPTHQPWQVPVRTRLLAFLAPLAAHLLGPGLLLGLPTGAVAAETRIAVAANFTGAVRALERAFEAEGPHRVTVSTGATGALYAQIRNGAPFHAFLAADSRRPRRLEAQGDAVAGSRFTYAVGRIVLWSPREGYVTGPASLHRRDFRHLAIANPRTAPYGLAARQTLIALGRWQALQDRIVRGENIAQAYQYVASGNAELGLVALSQVSGAERPAGGSRWRVPERHHAPIRQQAVLLAAGRDNPAARAFLDFLQGPRAATIMARFGYAPGAG